MAENITNTTSLFKAKHKGGLRKPQVRILEIFAKAKGPLNRAMISERAKVDLAMLPRYIGSHDEVKRRKNDKNACVSLLTLGYVCYASNEELSGAAYEITHKGRAALAKKQGAVWRGLRLLTGHQS